ncbi:hypothetical protein HanPI659440_Chr10g0373351 [Helianthus annuus]|nr:hypothetical protein HanPI659440_Chr10g0373351 [Helianthus annuus]
MVNYINLHLMSLLRNLTQKPPSHFAVKQVHQSRTPSLRTPDPPPLLKLKPPSPPLLKSCSHLATPRTVYHGASGCGLPKPFSAVAATIITYRHCFSFAAAENYSRRHLSGYRTVTTSLFRFTRFA